MKARQSKQRQQRLNETSKIDTDSRAVQQIDAILQILTEKSTKESNNRTIEHSRANK